MRTELSCCALVLSLASASAAAEPEATQRASTVRPQYPFAVEVMLSGRALRARLDHSAGGFNSPPNPGTTVSVGEQARDAFAAAGRRMFRPDGRPSAKLVVESVAAEFDFDADGWHVVVAHALVLRTPEGDELGRWTPKVREGIVGLGPRAIPVAFARAAQQSASRFESAFEEPPGVAAWLRERGVEPGSLTRPAAPADPQRPALTRPPAGPPRRYGLYVDAGGGLDIAPRISDGGSHLSADPALTVRAGFSAPWGFFQFARSVSRVEGLRAGVSIERTGVEAGPVLRLRPDIELAAGAGPHHVAVGRARSSVVSVFGAVRLATALASGRAHLRGGVEVRRDLGSSRHVQMGGGSQEVARTTSAWVFLGMELPLGD